MTGKIYTPVTLWEDFDENNFSAEVLKTLIYEDLVIEKVRVVRPFLNEKVGVYLEMFRQNNGENEKRPLVFVLQDVSKPINKECLKQLFNMGYNACSIDFAGKPDNFDEETAVFTEREYTVYPPALSYAEYKRARADIFAIGKTVKESAFYEWIISAKYAISYLKNAGYDNISVLCEKNSTIIGFSLAVTEKLSSFISLYGTGWQVPIGHKFGGEIRTDFSTEEFCILAGLEAQSYASYITCPTLMLVATNYKGGDFDRAYETFARTPESIYSAINYTISSGKHMSHSCYVDAGLFLDKYAKNKDIYLPNETFIDGKVEDGKIKVTVSPDAEGFERVTLFVADGEVDPAKRIYKTFGKVYELDEENKAHFTYTPTENSKASFIFAKTYYKNGFSVCSQVICKRFSDKEIKGLPEYNVIYSTADKSLTRVLEEIRSEKETFFSMNINPDAFDLKEGPFSINGLRVKNGIETIRVLSPNTDSILMVEVASDKEDKITVVLKCQGEEKEYRAQCKIYGGNLWYKLKFEIQNFKTEEGFPLKSFEKLEKIRIYSDGEFLLHTLLWV